MKRLIISLAAAILSLPVTADEGMWLLPLLKGQKFPEMQALGLKLQDYDIYSPDSASLKDAVVIFGGGCTGEIVSPEGLLLTNHHCGYGCIQRHSTLEHDYLTDGFWAMSRDQELPNPGMTVTFIDKIEDVTDHGFLHSRGRSLLRTAAICGRIRCVAAAARQQKKRQAGNQEKGNAFFHILLVPFTVVLCFAGRHGITSKLYYKTLSIRRFV